MSKTNTTSGVRQVWRGLPRSTRALTAGAAFSLLGVVALGTTLLAVGDLVSDSYAQVTSEVKAEIGGWRYVSISVGDTTMSMTPGSSTTTVSTSTEVSIETSVTSGATLYLSMAGETNALFLGGDDTSTYSIAATSTNNLSLDSLAAGTWGYATNSANLLYSAVPTSTATSATLGTGLGTSSDNNTFTVYYGMKVDDTLPSGTYSNSLTYTAVVDSGLLDSVSIESVVVNGTTVTDQQLVANHTNTITFTTTLQTNVYGVPRVYMTYSATDVECTNVSVTGTDEGYMQITCDVVPPEEAVQSGDTVSFTITARGDSSDPFCDAGNSGTSDCEAGEWRWGTYTVDTDYTVRLLITLSDIDTMQEMTTDICNNSSLEETKQLTDTRDGKTYWVAKLADGNCWMTQNLDFDLDSSVILTSDDSDVDTDTILSDATLYTALGSGNGSFTSSAYNVIQTWDVGSYVITDPTDYTSCGIITDLSTCSRLVSTENKSARTEITTDGTTYDDTTYDTHYLVGNYYSWGAATAGSASSVSGSGEAASSICPAGWTLPANTTSYTDSFYNLLTGLTYDVVTSAPYYFVRGGYVYSNGLGNAGNSGYYWSREADSSNDAYILYISSTHVTPSGYNSTRYYGNSVRCVAV